MAGQLCPTLNADELAPLTEDVLIRYDRSGRSDSGWSVTPHWGGFGNYRCPFGCTLQGPLRSNRPTAANGSRGEPCCTGYILPHLTGLIDPSKELCRWR